MGNKRRIILTVIIAGVLLISVVGTYAFFTSTADNSNKLAGTITTGTMALTFDDGNTDIGGSLMFGESVTKKFIITNTGSLEASLSLDWKDLINTYLDGSLTYNLSYSTEENGTYTEIIPETNMPVTEEKLTQTLASELSVPAGDTYYYNLTITLNNTDFDQTDDADAIFNTKFAVNDPVKYRYYKLTVDPNGGSLGEVNTPQEYLLQNNDTKAITGTPTRVGHTFLGWKLSGISSSYSDGTFTMGIGDTKLIAQWDVNKYNVTLNLDGGTYEGSTDLEVDYGSTIELSTPTKEGHTFAGWSTEVGSLDGNDFTLSQDADSVVTANWTVESFPYKVIHKQMNVSGSGYTEVDTETGVKEYGSTIDAPIHTYEGFTAPTQKRITIGVGENTVTYEYDRIEYTLNINPDGGTYSGNTSVKLLYGASTTISDPTKDGYTFGGWEVSSGTLVDTTETVSSFTIGASDATIKAIWNPIDYNYIVYHKQQQFDDSTYTVADTESGKKPFNTSYTPPRKTYTGFTTPPEQSLTIKIDEDEPATKNVLNYEYRRNKYALTINANNGTYTGSNPGTMYYGASINLGTPTRTGYKFTGWTSSGGTLNGSTFTMGTSAATVKATWEVLSYSYTVKHSKMNTDGSTYTLVSGDTQNLSANYGTRVTGTPKTNYGAGFGAGTCTSVTIGTDTTKNIVECKYPRNKFSITIKPNGGSYNGSTSNTTISNVYYGSTKTLATPTKTGYSYTWGVSGTGSSVSGSTFTMGTANAVVTANWTANTYTVNFNANGGSVSQGSKTVTYASTYGTLPTPTYTNYNFLGWYTAKTGGTKIVSSTNVAITSTQTLYAHWEKAGITVAQFIAKANPVNVTTYSSGTKTEMYTFSHEATSQTPAQTDYRYIGSSPNNYIIFNDETWRIIGVFPVKNASGAYENRIKIMRSSSIGNIVYNSTVKNIYVGGEVQVAINGAYYNRAKTANAICYDVINSGTTNCDFTTIGLNATARGQIDKATWYLGASSQLNSGPNHYKAERSNQTSSSQDGTVGNTTLNTYQYVGLMYPSDYVYTFGLGIDNTCYNNSNSCSNNPNASWMYKDIIIKRSLFTITPDQSIAHSVFYVMENLGVIGNGSVVAPVGVLPVVYLRSTVRLEGNGTASTPYTIAG